jgi:hypothetical protein
LNIYENYKSRKDFCTALYSSEPLWRHANVVKAPGDVYSVSPAGSLIAVSQITQQTQKIIVCDIAMCQEQIPLPEHSSSRVCCRSSPISDDFFMSAPLAIHLRWMGPALAVHCRASGASWTTIMSRTPFWNKNSCPTAIAHPWQNLFLQWDVFVWPMQIIEQGKFKLLCPGTRSSLHNVTL